MTRHEYHPRLRQHLAGLAGEMDEKSRQGQPGVVNPDGTTTAWNKDKTKVLHSHGPPARAG